MLPLRYPLHWQLAGVGFMVIALVAAMLPELPFLTIDPTAPFRISDKGLHILTFVYLALWFSGQYARASYWRIALGLVAFGTLIEVAQSLVAYRSAEWLDLSADVLGIAIGLLIAFFGVGGWSARIEAFLLR